jgi:hypothetical protein
MCGASVAIMASRLLDRLLAVTTTASPFYVRQNGRDHDVSRKTVVITVSDWCG